MDHLVATHIFTCPHCVMSALTSSWWSGSKMSARILNSVSLLYAGYKEPEVLRKQPYLIVQWDSLFPWRKCARYGGTRRYNPSEARFMGTGSTKYPSGSQGRMVRVSGDSFYCFYSLVPEVTHSFYWGLAIQYLYRVLEDGVPSLQGITSGLGLHLYLHRPSQSQTIQLVVLDGVICEMNSGIHSSTSFRIY